VGESENRHHHTPNATFLVKPTFFGQPCLSGQTYLSRQTYIFWSTLPLWSNLPLSANLHFLVNPASLVKPTILVKSTSELLSKASRPKHERQGQAPSQLPTSGSAKRSWSRFPLSTSHQWKRQEVMVTSQVHSHRRCPMKVEQKGNNSPSYHGVVLPFFLTFHPPIGAVQSACYSRWREAAHDRSNTNQNPKPRPWCTILLPSHSGRNQAKAPMHPSPGSKACGP